MAHDPMYVPTAWQKKFSTADNAVAVLNEWAQRQQQPTQPNYLFFGPPPLYQCRVNVNEFTYQTPNGHCTKKDAKQMAAAGLLDMIERKDTMRDPKILPMDFRPSTCDVFAIPDAPDLHHNAISRMNEWTQARGIGPPEYTYENTSRVAHYPSFYCTIQVQGFPAIISPRSSTKKNEAKRLAAEMFLMRYG